MLPIVRVDKKFDIVSFSSAYEYKWDQNFVFLGENHEQWEIVLVTDGCVEVTEDEKELLDAKLQLLAAHAEEEPAVSVVYFSPDGRKAGGEYLELDDRVVKIDVMDGVVCFAGGARIPVGDIRSIDGELVSVLDREG